MKNAHKSDSLVRLESVVLECVPCIAHKVDHDLCKSHISLHVEKGGAAKCLWDSAQDTCRIS